ncbi:MAG: CRISPR-associated endonuclease Cas2 [Candidatus Pacebacteria bacterium]|nr:CRISPR-associated endonuclease Cas2 [Candidatus Paceibacterota bacterium]
MAKTALKTKRAQQVKGLVTKTALGLLLVGGGIVALAMAPGLAMALKLVDPNPRKAIAKIERALKNLAKDGDVEVSYKGKERRYRITPTGAQKLAQLEFKDYQPTRFTRWDGKFRIICFDIPETDKYTRTLFQTKLSDLGFYRLQYSVFVTPYNCKELIVLADKAFGLRNWVRVIVAEAIDNEQHLMNFFKIKR